MMRDITIGQYYLTVRIFFLAGIWGGSTVSGDDDRFVQSSFRIYDKRIKADHGAVADYDVF